MEMPQMTSIPAQIAWARSSRPMDGPTLENPDSSVASPNVSRSFSKYWTCSSSVMFFMRIIYPPSPDFFTIIFSSPDIFCIAFFTSSSVEGVPRRRFHSVPPRRSIPCRKPKVNTMTQETRTRAPEIPKKIFLYFKRDMMVFLFCFYKHSKQGAGYGNRGKHAYKHSHKERQSKSLYEA